MADKTFDEIHLLIEAKIAELLKPMGKGRERADKILKRRIYVLIEALDAINEVKDLDGYKKRLKDLRASYRTSVVSLETLLDELDVNYRRRRVSASQNGGASLVNVNTASAPVLALLPGIGESLAEAIMEARQQRQFNTLKDLERVSGIGPSMRKKLSGLAAC